jgi:hypothetical protein
MLRTLLRGLRALAGPVACAAAVAACGSSGNPVIDSPNFVSTCISKLQASQTHAAATNPTDYCQCYQQKLESVGLGAQTLRQASRDPQAAVAVSICGPDLLGPASPAAPGATTT